MAETESTRKTFKPQKLRWMSNALCLHHVDFPIFYIECMSERHFLVAGGGGSSNTGVRNQINILELVPTRDSCAADLVMKYQTPIPEAIMAGALFKDSPSSLVSNRFMTAGSNPTLYELGYVPTTKSFKITDYRTFKDNKVMSEMKSVKYIPGKILTGGMDGKLYIWDLHKGTIEHIINAHSKEIDEIDVDLVSKQIVTLSRREAKCSVWSMTNHKLIQEFNKNSINREQAAPFKNAFRSCKFAYDNSQQDSKNSYLFIACNPDRPKNPSMVFRLSEKNYKEITSAPLTTDGIMAMTINSNGKVFAIGTTSGTVQVFDVKSLKQIYKLQRAHHNIITNLAFLPAKEESSVLTNSHTCPLLSASIDNRIVLHRPEKSSLTSKLCKLLCFFLLMYLTFNLRLIWHP